MFVRFFLVLMCFFGVCKSFASHNEPFSPENTVQFDKCPQNLQCEGGITFNAGAFDYGIQRYKIDCSFPRGAYSVASFYEQGVLRLRATPLTTPCLPEYKICQLEEEIVHRWVGGDLPDSVLSPLKIQGFRVTTTRPDSQLLLAMDESCSGPKHSLYTTMFQVASGKDIFVDSLHMHPEGIQLKYRTVPVAQNSFHPKIGLSLTFSGAQEDDL